MEEPGRTPRFLCGRWCHSLVKKTQEEEQFQMIHSKCSINIYKIEIGLKR